MAAERVELLGAAGGSVDGAATVETRVALPRETEPKSPQDPASPPPKEAKAGPQPLGRFESLRVCSQNTEG